MTTGRGWYVKGRKLAFPYGERLCSGPFDDSGPAFEEMRRIRPFYPDATLDVVLETGRTLPERKPRTCAPGKGWQGPLRVPATGHRWSRLPFDRTPEAERRLEALAYAFLEQLAPDEAISGLAVGWDTAFAQAAVRLQIPLVAAVPGKRGEQTRGWDWGDEGTHDWLLRQAVEVHYVGEGYAFGRACVLRDKWMVDRGHVVAALWSGMPSGTGTTVRYADRQKVPVVNLWGLI